MTLLGRNPPQRQEATLLGLVGCWLLVLLSQAQTVATRKGQLVNSSSLQVGEAAAAQSGDEK